MSVTKTSKLTINPAVLETATFRANQNYELVLFDHLSDEEKQMLAELQQQPNFYGLLRPVESAGLSIKSVSQDTALLYLTLREPGRLPSYARIAAGENYEAVIAKLVLDQILEIEKGGEFVSGALAYDLLYGETVSSEARGRIGQVSIAAMKYGQALAVTDTMELSARLYNYGRIPISSRWRQKFSGPDEVAKLLGIDERGSHKHFLAAHWQPTPKPTSLPGPQGLAQPDSTEKSATATEASKTGPPTSPGREDSIGWLSWNAPESRTLRQNMKSGSTYKLYISPLPDFIEQAFTLAARTLVTTSAFHFKVGADLQGMLRSDKMVAYFSSFDGLQSAANLLAGKLDGCPAQGVPFTAEIAGDGLLSWGVDPPESVQLLSWQPRESWRLWLTNRLANALVVAKNAPHANGSNRLESWQYALQRLRLEGVDTDLWTPAARLWK